MSSPKSYLGTGWSFPPTFSRRQNIIKMVSEEEDIRESLNLLLSTAPGERLTNPDYGCSIHDLAFETVDGVTEYLMRDSIERAILFFEPRITIEKIEFDTAKEIEGVVYISLYYFVRKTNIRNNIVYPFYKLEGTLVDED